MFDARAAVTLSFSVGKQTYFTVYGILLHELPVVAILSRASEVGSPTKTGAKDATYSSPSIGIAKFACREVWNLYREVIPLTHSALGSQVFLKPFLKSLEEGKIKKNI